MYLDKVEIHGFKSFGDAVKLSIPQGITGVIGPNGSGKSNVSDAIRWVLGEQSAKSLRGSNMQDIIFAGTEKRKSLGYAEVALTIKNPDQAVPIAYNEIVVKRRVYRSGESEYFINGSTCRLKDVQELFMDTGIGKDGYSIIGQGQIDRVLSSKPEERRTLFEEAAGIYKYKVRRQEAERKLEKQRDNLVRIQDIILEIEGRLEPLSIEAEKTTQFLKLKESLKEVDVNIFIFEIERIEKEIAALNELITSIELQIKDAQEEENALKARQVESKQKKDALYTNIETLISEISNLEKQQEKRQSQITINEEKVINIETLLEQVVEDQKAQALDHQNKKERLSLLETKRTALEIEHASKMTIIEQEETRVNALIKALSDLEGTIDSSKEELHQKMREIDLFEAELQKNDGMEAQLDYRLSQISEQIALLNSDIQHQEVKGKLLEKQKSEGLTKLEDLKARLVKVQESKQALEKDKFTKEKALNQMTQNMIQTERQMKWLEQIKEEHEGYYGSVKQVLKLAKGEASRWQGIVGVVGELVEVSREYETAIVTALGGAIQNIVTRSEKDAKDMITVMKQRGISRVTFLPQDTVRSSQPINENSLKSEKGFLGFGNELIKYPAEYSNIISSLLGRILIIDNMDNASRIARKYQYKYKLVTLEGEVFNSGGSLSGGSTKNQSNNIFSRARELKEAAEKCADYQKQVESHKVLLETLNASLSEETREVEALTLEINALDTKVKEHALEWDKTEHALKLTKANQLQLLTERNNIEDNLEQIKSGRADVKERTQELKATIGDDEEALEALEKKLTQLKQEKDEANNALTEKKISLSNTKQNMKYMLEQMREIEEALSGQGEKQEQITQKMAKFEQEKQALLEENTHIEVLIQEDKKGIEVALEKRKQYDVEKVTLEQEEVKLTEIINKATEKLSNLKEERYRLENKKDNSAIQKQNWGNTMWEQYELTYNRALEYKMEDYSITELKKRSVDMRGQIKQIGNVNVNAVEEYKETKTRYEFLTGQKEDMEKAEAALIEMIDELMSQMKEIFRAQFAIIAENFTEVFKELFGGGEAYLQLLDEENILESGIEIIAKPPGKKLQNMTLLSGGERTLTAISLIFGILKLKPSPFCVLDEIEAALDDANVLRFADYLEKLSKETQFIVITHRKGTMERAHTLYGVTMQERGVSTILSIELEDASNYMDQKKSN